MAIRGVRHPGEISGLCLSQRMLVRLGALLKKGLAVSPAVLESALPGSALERLLLDAVLLERAAALGTDGLRQLAQDRPDPAGVLLSIEAAPDGVRVLCLQEELEAAEGWGTAPETADAEGTVASPLRAGEPDAALQPEGTSMPLAGETAERLQQSGEQGGLVLSHDQPPHPSLSPLGRGKGEGVARAPSAWGGGTAGESLFTPAEIERWRLKLVAAGAVAERMEAMRTLVLAPLAPRDKLDVVLQGLSDKEPAMRAEAAGLLPGLGADQDVAGALAGLNHSDPSRRTAAVERLLKLLGAPSPQPSPPGGEGRVRGAVAQDLEVAAAAVCALTMLRCQSDAALTGQLLGVLCLCAGAVGRSRERVAEIVRVLSGLLPAAASQGSSTPQVEALLPHALRLMKALAAAAPQTLLPVLQAERERCTDTLTEAFLLQAMLDLPSAGVEEDRRVLASAVSYLGRETEEGRDSRAVGMRLVRRGERALEAACEGFAAGHAGAQRYLLILFDDICRLNKVSPAGLERAAQVVLRAIETGSKALRMAAMECRFITSLEITEETRRGLAKAFLDCVADFTFRSDIEKVEATLGRLGLPALEPLLERLSPDRPRDERVRAVRLLGEWALNVRAPHGQMARMQQAVTDLLRRLQALALDQAFPDRGELLCALGKLVASPAASKEADAVITRSLLDAAKSTDAAAMPRALEGLSYVASSRRAHAETIQAAVVLLRHTLDDMSLDISAQTKRRDGETVIEISGGEKFTRLLPVILEGLGRVGCASSCPPAVTRDVAKLLLERWKKVSEGGLVWGPANTALLVRALKDLGCHRTLPAELRLEILRSFAPRHVQTHIMHSITEILAADDTPATAVGAVTIGYAILGRRSKEGQFTKEDREDILIALGRIAGRKVLGGSTPEAQQQALAFRRLTIDELFKGVNDMVPSAYECLSALRQKPSLPEDLRKEIDRRLKDYESLVLA